MLKVYLYLKANKRSRKLKASRDEPLPDEMPMIICRCLSKMLVIKSEVEKLCVVNLKYALTGEESALDAVAIENQIKDYQEQIDLLMEKEETTGGDPDRYEKEIVKIYEKVSVLRGQLKLAREQVDINETANKEVERFISLLKEYDGDSFSEYDDLAVHRLVECIRVMPDKKIIITLKGGIQGEETVE